LASLVLVSIWLTTDCIPYADRQDSGCHVYPHEFAPRSFLFVVKLNDVFLQTKHEGNEAHQDQIHDQEMKILVAPDNPFLQIA
jgi:hypothetical protein